MKAAAQPLHANTAAAKPKASGAPARLLRRKCACGGTGGAGAVCADCAKKRKIQRRASHGDRRMQTAPDVVSDVLERPGHALDATTRRRMETVLGHDFRRVRIHTDDRAAESARAVDAHAYTVGQDVIFDQGQFAPETAVGHRLLVHELAHVVQQGREAPDPSSEISVGPVNDRFEQQAEAVAEGADRALEIGDAGPNVLQRQSRSGLLGPEPRLRLDVPPPMLLAPGSIREAFIFPAPPRLELTEPTFGTDSGPRLPNLLDQRLTPPPAFTPVTIIRVPRCVPSTPLTWADFQGTAPAASRFSAETAFSVDPANIQGNTMFQATLTRSSSWVKPQFVNPTDPAQNECPARIAQCEAFFNGLGPGQTGTWRFGAGTCPAIPQNTPPAQATSLAECTTVIGGECNTHAPANSARLLAHEQGHWDIACVLTSKADDALAAGSSLPAVTRSLTRQLTAQTRAYDNQTNHGCNAAQQATWTTAIAGNLPAVRIP